MNHKNILLQIPEYNPENGLRLEWEVGYEIKLSYENGIVILQANESGLKSLAKHFLCLANPEVPSKRHIHLDEFNSLETGSLEFIIEKTTNEHGDGSLNG